jgi:hypothetical protein
MSDDTLYQYHTSSGEEFWIAFDPTRPCIYCERPVGSLSMGGPALCGACDCGYHHDGRGKWTLQEYPALEKRARRNLDAMNPRTCKPREK